MKKLTNRTSRKNLFKQKPAADNKSPGQVFKNLLNS